MTSERDRESDDRFVDHCLQEELGGHRAPDLASRIAAASPARLATAAANVDAAAASAARHARGRTAVAAAAAILLGAVTLWFGTRGPAAPPLSVTERALVLLDDFHRVMPNDPAHLRDATRRQNAAKKALPVLREILALHAENPGETTFGARIFEFEVYAAELGDAELLRELQQRAGSGDVSAATVMATARIATSDGSARATALAELGSHLQRQPNLEMSIVQALRTADLSREEAETFSLSLTDPGLRRVLMHAAELAANGPRHLLGQRLDLFGRLLDDRLFSTSSLRGKVVLVCFWASWCQPCLQALEQVRRAQQLHPELVVVAVSCDHEVRALRNYLHLHPDPQWIQFYDRTRPGWHEFAIEHGIPFVPFLLLLDREGIVRNVDTLGDLDNAIRGQLGR